MGRPSEDLVGWFAVEAIDCCRARKAANAKSRFKGTSGEAAAFGRVLEPLRDRRLHVQRALYRHRSDVPLLGVGEGGYDVCAHLG